MPQCNTPQRGAGGIPEGGGPGLENRRRIPTALQNENFGGIQRNGFIIGSRRNADHGAGIGRFHGLPDGDETGRFAVAVARGGDIGVCFETAGVAS